MNVVSMNVGLPRTVEWRGKSVRTSIYKDPVLGRVAIRALNIEGDRQSDLRVHGGPDKAIYGYPSEHYPFWRKEFPDMLMPHGMFGENLTTSGMLEVSVFIGDRYRFGTAELTVTQPRMPCYKLAMKFGRDDMIKRFLESRFSGFYFAVSKEGEAQAGDALELVGSDQEKVSVRDITELYLSKQSNPALLERVLRLQSLPQSWKDHLLK
jgi:MOSC domain-containing protein YiiM